MEILKRDIRSLEMLAHGEMENLDFPCAQECSNDCIPFQPFHCNISIYKLSIKEVFPVGNVIQLNLMS